MDIGTPKNWPRAETMEQVKRERETEERVRAMDAPEIVDWIHSLEDSYQTLEEANQELADSLERILYGPVLLGSQTDDEIIRDWGELGKGHVDDAKNTLQSALEKYRSARQ